MPRILNPKNDDKNYTKPVLKEHGDILQITKGTGHCGEEDQYSGTS